jgi:hypothetical protein
MAIIANNTNAKLARKESTLIHLSKKLLVWPYGEC